MILDVRTARVLVTLLAFGVAGVLLYTVRKTLVVVLFAILFAYLLDPAVTWVQHTSPFFKEKRTWAIAQVYVALAIVLGAVFVWIGPLLASQGEALGRTMPSLLDKVTTGRVIWQIGAKHGWSNNTQVRVEQFVREHREDIMAWIKHFGFYAAHLVENIVWLVIIPILAIFFLKDGRDMSNAGIDLLPRQRNRTFLTGIAEDLNIMLAHFIRSQIILAGLSTVTYTAALLLLRFPFAFVLAVASGLMEFVPVVGPFVAAVSILGVGFLTGYSHWGIIVLILAAWRIVQDYVISPRIMGGKLELHPLAAILAVMAGGEIAGVLGVYLAIPVMAASRIIWKRVRRHSESSQVSFPSAA
jgi:predicted PurR-regulated permease PerM